MKTPENTPPGEKYRVRLTVRDETTDGLLANLSAPAIRRSLPGFLYVFSEQAYVHNPDDYIDGKSDKELAFGSYRRKIDDYNRASFGADARFEVADRFIRLGVSLGHQAASRIIIPPVFNDNGPDALTLLVYYALPGVGSADFKPPRVDALDDLRDHLQSHPRDVFDELALVNVNTPDALRPRTIRTRERQDDILAS